MISRRAFGLWAGGAAATAVGCAAPEPLVLPELTFAHLTPILFNVAEAEVIDLYRPPLAPPNVEHTFPVSPAWAARAWARQRIKAGGDEGKVTFTIHDASVTAVPLNVTGGALGLLFDQQAVRYEASLEVSVAVRRVTNLESSARSHVKRTRTVPESTTLSELDFVFYSILEELMQDLDKQMELAIRQYLASTVF